MPEKEYPRNTVGLGAGSGEAWHWINYGGNKTNQPLSSVRSVRLRSSARPSNFQSQSHKPGSAMPADHRGSTSFILAIMPLNGFKMSEDIFWTSRWGEGVRLFPCSTSLNFACERNRRWDVLSWKTNMILSLIFVIITKGFVWNRRPFLLFVAAATSLF